MVLATLLLAGCTSGGRPHPAPAPSNGEPDGPPVAGCAVSHPSTNRPLPPSPSVRFVNGEYIPGNSNAYGNADLWVGLPVDGQLVTQRLPDAGFAAMLGWWQVHPGALSVRAAPLHGPSHGFTADVRTTAFSGRNGYRVSRLVFPERGCWRITGRMRGRAPLTFTVNVSDASPTRPTPTDPDDEWHVSVAPS